MSVDVPAVRAAVEGEGALAFAVYALCDEVERLRMAVALAESDADHLDTEAARWRTLCLSQRSAFAARLRRLASDIERGEGEP